MSWVWVKSDAELAEAVARVAGESAVAIDTEFHRRDTYYPQVALVQLAVADACWLIDPLALTDPGPLRELLEDPAVIKVLHSASEDLEVFERWLGILPRPLFDTQKAAAMLNLGFSLGYRGLVEALLDVALAKEETTSNWLQRPLSDAQCEYAAQDVTYLFQCWQQLSVQAQSTGRLDWILQEGAQITTGGRGPLAKFKSAWKLRPESLAVLLALIEWREAEARERDKPRSWILPDKTLTELAKRCPDNTHGLTAIEGVPRGLVRRSGDALVTLIAETVSAAADKPPTPLPAPASSQVRGLAKALAQPLAAIATDLNMNVEVLMPSREIELLAREAQGEHIQAPGSWSGWRADTVVAPLRASVQSLKAAQS